MTATTTTRQDEPTSPVLGGGKGAALVHRSKRA
jgi:hypothetical protein